MKKLILPIAVTVIVLLVGGFVIFSNDGAKNNEESAKDTEVVTEENGIQYINMEARAGYTPSTVTAKANTPTVIRMKTKNTFDCSSSLVIPAINYQGLLQATGEEEIEVPLEKTTGKLQGLCGMGMYSFVINFQ